MKKVHFDRVPPSYRNSIDRHQEIELLTQYFLSYDKRVVGILGQGGVGKSSLAKQFAYKYLDHFQGGIYEYPTLPKFGRAVNAEEIFLPFDQPSLLIIECDRFLKMDDLHYYIEYLLKSNSICKLLLLSRATDVFEKIGDIAVVHLNEFSESELIDFINRSIDGAVSEVMLREIISKSQNLPALALRVAKDIHAQKYGLKEFLESSNSISFPGIVGIDGEPLASNSIEAKGLITEMAEINSELFTILARSPEEIYKLPPRKFELVVAEMLHRQGYEIEVTPLTRDGGVDIYALRRDDLGKVLMLVECKRYAPTRKVGIGVIQRLNGVVDTKRATAGLVVTSSFFTKPALEEQKRLQYRMSLKDFFGIQEWIKNHRNRE